jgi:transposase-like protein
MLHTAVMQHASGRLLSDAWSASGMLAGFQRSVGTMGDRGLLSISALLSAVEITDIAGDGGVGSDAVIRSIQVSAVSAGLSPRSSGLDTSHVECLIEAEWPLAPIVVHRDSMQVIDGHHRIAAAIAKGLKVIDGYLFDGPIDLAFLLAVHANVTHGLPLSLSDRRSAALKIIVMHGEWSDRAIAVSTGLSASAVGRLRCATDVQDQLHTRIGRDGRCRPLSTADARQRAADMFAQTPGASLRQVARAVGLSPGTVRDVRARLARGESPAPGSRPHGHCDIGNPARAAGPVANIDTVKHEVKSPTANSRELAAVLEALSRDPTLRMTESGRDLLRWLHTHAVYCTDNSRVVESTPDHCVEQLLVFARECANGWTAITNDLAIRLRTMYAYPSVCDVS